MNMVERVVHKIAELGPSFVNTLDAYADRISAIGVKLGLVTGATTTGAAMADKADIFPLNDVTLYVGIFCTVTTTVASVWLNFWHKRRMQALRLMEIEAGIDARRQIDEGSA